MRGVALDRRGFRQTEDGSSGVRLKTRIEIEDHGQCGLAHYREDANHAVFDWEIGGSVVALVWARDSDTWAVSHPWAAGRDREILIRVAEELTRQRAPGCRVELASHGKTAYIVGKRMPGPGVEQKGRALE